MKIDVMQANVLLRWNKQKDNPCHNSTDTQHMLVHLTKALGKVATALNDAEHENRNLRPEEVSKYLADLVICSAMFGGYGVDLNKAVEDRIEEKFPALS